MRILHSSVITLFIVLLATVAAAQKTDAEMASRFLKNGTVPAPPVGEPKIDQSKVKFVPGGRMKCSVGFSNKVEMDIVGIVDRAVDVSDDPTAQQILQMGFAFGREHCSENSVNAEGRRRGLQVFVSLFPGDPATTTEGDVLKLLEARRILEIQRIALPPDKVNGVWDSDKPGLIFGYLNYPKALKKARAYYAQEARERDAALAQRSQAEQRWRRSGRPFLRRTGSSTL